MDENNIWNKRKVVAHCNWLTFDLPCCRSVWNCLLLKRMQLTAQTGGGLLIRTKGWSASSSIKHCQGQLQTPQSLTICNFKTIHISHA